MLSVVVRRYRETCKCQSCWPLERASFRDLKCFKSRTFRRPVVQCITLTVVHDQEFRSADGPKAARLGAAPDPGRSLAVTLQRPLQSSCPDVPQDEMRALSLNRPSTSHAFRPCCFFFLSILTANGKSHRST